MNPVVRPAIASRSTSGASLHFADMHLQNLKSPLAFGPIHQHLAIETAGAQQRRVENFRPVGGGEQDDAGAGVETVELGEKLIERLLLFVIAAEARRRRGCGRARRVHR